MNNDIDCKSCYKKLTDCKCNIDELLENEGSVQSVTFGESGIHYSWIKIEDKLCLKLQLDDTHNFVLLSESSLSDLQNIVKPYFDIKDAIRTKKLLDWDCNSCGKKTNNLKEYCDECISENRHEDCDCD